MNHSRGTEASGNARLPRENAPCPRTQIINTATVSRGIGNCTDSPGPVNEPAQVLMFQVIAQRAEIHQPDVRNFPLVNSTVFVSFRFGLTSSSRTFGLPFARRRLKYPAVLLPVFMSSAGILLIGIRRRER